MNVQACLLSRRRRSKDSNDRHLIQWCLAIRCETTIERTGLSQVVVDIHNANRNAVLSRHGCSAITRDRGSGQEVCGCGIGIQKRKVMLYYCPHELFHCLYSFEPSSWRPAAFLDAIDSNIILATLYNKTLPLFVHYQQQHQKYRDLLLILEPNWDDPKRYQWWVVLHWHYCPNS